MVKVGRGSVGTGIFVTKTRRDLEIFVKARHHQKLLELLRGLRQGIKLARMQTRRHQKVPSTLGGRGGDDRGLIFAKILIPHPFADRRYDIRTQRHVGLHLFTAQIEIAIGQPRFFGVFLIAKHHQRQFTSGAKHFEVTYVNLDLACGQFGVDQAFIAGLHRAIDANTPLAAQFFHFGKHRAVRIAQDLRHAVMVAQVNEQNPAVIAHAVHPTRQANCFAHIGRGQRGAAVRAVSMHVFSPHLGAVRTSAQIHLSRGGKSRQQRNIGRDINASCQGSTAQKGRVHDQRNRQG